MIGVLLFVIIIISECLAIPSSGTSQRNLWQFNNMISYKGYNAADYSGYGCWCGSGNYGPLALDATDNCCRVHDQCYDQISGGLFGCSPKLVAYSWEQLPNKEIRCKDNEKSCSRNACECDKAAVDCFEQHRSTHTSDLISYGNFAHMAKICNPQ